MRAIVFDDFGDESVLRIGEIESPPMNSGELRDEKGPLGKIALKVTS